MKLSILVLKLSVMVFTSKQLFIHPCCIRNIPIRSCLWSTTPPPSPQVTPLFLACRWNVDLKSKQCNAPISEAALLLLSKGADPNKVAIGGRKVGAVTPLYGAVSIGSIEVVRSLLERGARQDLDTGGGELG